MTREQFIKKWRNHLAGMALFGVVSDAKDNVLQRAAHALDIPAEVDRVLGLIYADLTDPKPVANGAPASPARK